MNPESGLPPAHSTRSSAREMNLYVSDERAAAGAEERAEELHQLEVTRRKRQAEQEELLFQAQLVALRAPAQQPAAQLQDAEGGTAPEVKSLTAVLPGIASTHLVAIHKNKFLAENHVVVRFVVQKRSCLSSSLMHLLPPSTPSSAPPYRPAQIVT